MPDFNDIHKLNGEEAVKEQINNAQKEPYVPDGFAIKEVGIFQLNKDGKSDLFVCDPLYIEAMVRDCNSDNWSRFLTWHDPDGEKHEWVMPSYMLAADGAEYRRYLISQGLKISPSKKAQDALRDYIMTAHPAARITSVNTPGWHGTSYVAPDGEVYGDNTSRILLQEIGTLPKLDKKGTLQSWQDSIGQYVLGNSRLVLAVCVSLAGPLLRFANQESGGFHFSGESSGGKTTALRIATSIWGLSIRTWRTTDNAAESWARSANDGFLAIDELSQVDGKAADAMAYMLGNGQAKGRANRDGSVRNVAEFRLTFLSTGETGLSEKVRENNRKLKAGQTVRMLEIPADAGCGMRMFEELHGFSSADEFAKHFRQVVNEHKGYVAVAWLERLAKIDANSLHEAVQKTTKEWVQKYLPTDADGQVSRVAHRFALLAVTGELATTFGILPWPDNEASNAAARCFYDWLSSRGGVGSYEIREGIQQIHAFIEKHGSSRFQDISNDRLEGVVYDRAGYKKVIEDQEYVYLLTRDFIQNEILGGSKNITGILKEAMEKGLVLPDSEGKSTRPIDIPGLPRKARMVWITPARYKGE